MAVYTEVSTEALAGFLAAYEIGGLVAFNGIAEGVENSNFFLRTTAGAYILTLYEKRVDPADLPYFLGLMDHLAARQIACPVPVRARSGAMIGHLCGRPATLTTFLPGVWPRQVQPSHCSAVGATLAVLHRAGADYRPVRRNALGPQGWPTLLSDCRATGEALMPGLGAELDATLNAVLSAWPVRLPVGQIHADLFPDNVFFLDNTVSGLIDFFFSATDLLAYDIAICLNAWCFEPDRSFNVVKGQALLSAYASVRPLAEAEAASLPVLARGAALRFLLTRLFDWANTPPGAVVRRKDPLEYLARVRFHATVAEPGAYGF